MLGFGLAEEKCRSVRLAPELIVARRSARNEFGWLAQDDSVFYFFGTGVDVGVRVGSVELRELQVPVRLGRSGSLAQGRLFDSRLN